MIDYTNFSSLGAQKTYDEGLRNYMLKIYNYMAAGIFITAFMAYATLNFHPLTGLIYTVNSAGQMGFTTIGNLMFFAPLGISFYFFFNFQNITVNTARSLFWVYAGLMGITLSHLSLAYTGQSIAKTLLITASVFGSMSIYGYTTKRDLTSIGSFLVMGLIGLIIASLVNIFLASPAIHFATSFIGVVIFMGLTAWDTQKLKSIYYQTGGGVLGNKMAVVGAFSLYLDFINLFLYLLRFFGDRK